MKGCRAPDDSLLAFAQAQSSQVDVLEEFGDGHQVDEAVAFFAAHSLIAKTLREQQMRHEMRWIRLDRSEYHQREDNVARDRRGGRWRRG